METITQTQKEYLESLSQEQLAILYRFLSTDSLPVELINYMVEVFKQKGFMTPAISKKITWDNHYKDFCNEVSNRLNQAPKE